MQALLRQRHLPQICIVLLSIVTRWDCGIIIIIVIYAANRADDGFV